MPRPMTPPERHVVINDVIHHERALARLHKRGPWNDPKYEEWMTGRSYEAKVADHERVLNGLRSLAAS